MTEANDRARFGETVLGPILAEFAFRLWLFAESQPSEARLLFCARGGLRMRLLYETFLNSIGRSSPLPVDDLMVSRLVAARPALLARAPAGARRDREGVRRRNHAQGDGGARAS